METRMNLALKDEGVDLGSTTTNALSQVMNDYHNNVTNTSVYRGNTFTKLYWDQQKLTASKGDARGMRWHPMVIKWCLNLKLQSAKAYQTLKNSILQLHCDTTLQSFIHWTRPTSGIATASLHQLL